MRIIFKVLCSIIFLLGTAGIGQSDYLEVRRHANFKALPEGNAEVYRSFEEGDYLVDSGVGPHFLRL
jgi:hypothetical protein